MENPNIYNFMGKEACDNYDFSKAPHLILSKKPISQQIKSINTREDKVKWFELQNEFIASTKSKTVFNKTYIENNKRAYDSFFAKRGLLSGKILDIGGGWGLFRQWWNYKESDIFIVHDPGVERFLHGPHQFHHEYYTKAFKHPLTFVEGFGEKLPYKDNIFNVCLAAAVLEHCVDPRKVLKEAHRCLLPGGSILVIINHEPKGRRILKLLGYLLKPKLLLTQIYNRLKCRVHQMHMFTPEQLREMLTQTGFSNITATTTTDAVAIDVYEAIK